MKKQDITTEAAELDDTTGHGRKEASDLISAGDELDDTTGRFSRI